MVITSSQLVNLLMITRATATFSKQLWIVRHGQAMHNPRAEAAKDNGCSHEEFLDLMRLDDTLDADLTDLGEEQAARVGRTMSWGDLDLIVSSPLSRAIRTADLSTPCTTCSATKRIAVENFREINGWLLNAKRRSVEELQQRFPKWDFGELTQNDDLWSNELETESACSERGYQGLCWIMQRQEKNILLVAHGGLLRFMMQQHPLVKMLDGRTNCDSHALDGRFKNCEARRYQMSWEQQQEGGDSIVTLKEIDSQ